MLALSFSNTQSLIGALEVASRCQAISRTSFSKIGCRKAARYDWLFMAGGCLSHILILPRYYDRFNSGADTQTIGFNGITYLAAWFFMR